MAGSSRSDSPKPDRNSHDQLRSLEKRIADAKRADEALNATQRFRQREMTGMGRAFRFASEFVAAVLVGVAIGYAIDLMLGTRPWAMIVLLLLGFAAGVINVIRAAADMSAEASVDGVSVVDTDDDD